MSPAAKLNIISSCHVLYCACTARRAWDAKVASANTQQYSPVPLAKKPRFKKNALCLSSRASEEERNNSVAPPSRNSWCKEQMRQYHINCGHSVQAAQCLLTCTFWMWSRRGERHWILLWITVVTASFSFAFSETLDCRCLSPGKVSQLVYVLQTSLNS